MLPEHLFYTPAAGAVLKAGAQTLSAVFTPADTSTYSSATATVQLTVNQATPTISWAAPAGVANGDRPQRGTIGRHRECARNICLQPGSGRRSHRGDTTIDSRVFPHGHHRLRIRHSPHPLPLAVGRNDRRARSPGPVGCGGPTINVTPSMSVKHAEQHHHQRCQLCGHRLRCRHRRPLTSTIMIPCNVSFTVRPVPYSQTPNQTATIIGSIPVYGLRISYQISGCSQIQSIQYLESNGKSPSNGGGFLEMNAGHNQYHSPK